ncbi:MAG: tetratricopeptide repeat protein, partial [Candidatus Binatia bacterium]
GWREFDRSRYRIADDFSREFLKGVPPGASVAASDDNVLFVLIYLHYVENVRPDVHLILQGVGGADLPPLHFNPETDALYFSHHPNWNVKGLEILPLGLGFRAWRAGVPPPPPVMPKERLDGELDPLVPKDYLTDNVIGHFHYMRGVTFEYSDWPFAVREFAEALRVDPHNDVLFYNIGLIYRRQGLLEESLSLFEKSYEINPRHIASTSRAQASDKIHELRAEIRRLAAVERGFPGGRADALTGAKLAQWHRNIASWLEGRGESLAARGHRLRTVEVLTGLR